MSLTRLAQGTFSLVVGLGLAAPVLGNEVNLTHGCVPVEGTFTEILVDARLSTFDPFGRVVNFTDGTIESVGTAILTTVGPGADPGTLEATTRHLFILNPSDQIIATGVAVFTPIPNTDNVHDRLILTIKGGLGKFENAIGAIEAVGTGFDFFPLPPGPAPGRSFFVFHYSGQVCVP